MNTKLNMQDIQWIVDNWDSINDENKSFLKPDRYSKEVEGLKAEEHFVLLLLDRQKPSVIQDYSFDEERIGVTRTGKVVWGFDSGCSCPTPWNDSYPDCYSVSKSWKEFELKTTEFDMNWSEEAKLKLLEIKKTVLKSVEGKQ